MTPAGLSRDRHEIRAGVLAHLPPPRRSRPRLGRLARRWRASTWIASLGLALIPALAWPTPGAGALSAALVLAVLAWDAFARRCARWERYARERAALARLLGEEAVEAFYTASRDERAFAAEIAGLVHFGHRPAATADPVHALRRRWLDRQARRFLTGAGLRVLDLGCQHGLMTGAFDRPGRSVVAVDLNLESLKIAGRGQPRWSLAGADARTLPFRAERFDAINFAEVIEHLSDPRAALAEIRRCLRPGGIVLLTTNNRHGLTWRDWLNPLCVAERIAGLVWPALLPPPALVWQDEALGLAFYHTDFDRREIRQLIRDAGLEIVSQGSYAHGGELWRLVGRLFPRVTEGQAAEVLYAIDRLLDAVPVARSLGMHWLIVARRPHRPGGRPREDGRTGADAATGAAGAGASRAEERVRPCAS